MELQDFAQVKYYLDRSICIREEVHGSTTAEAGESLHTFGLMYKNQNLCIMANKYFRRALAVRERALGHWHAETAASCIELGDVLAELNQLEEAGVYILRGRSIREMLFGPDDEWVI